jgi:uncharacterized protein (TIGR00299 family) protein
MRVAYFDCFNGAGGDMIVASLLDAGADAAALREGLAGLGLSGYTLAIERINKQGLAATRFHVALDATTHQPHRHLKHIVEIIDAANLPHRVRDRAKRIFTRLAEAEARIHGATIEKVHFHEVGAVDAIVDVVGAVFALELLGVERVACSPIPVGSGAITCAHGVMPVPAPATAELLKGVPIAACDETGELTTPTAAAVLTTLATEFGPMPAMKTASIGYGAGTRDGQKRPNVLRVLIGDAAPTAGADVDQVMLLETNLDDATPQTIGYCVEQLFSAGALDVWTQPILMKKQRSGVLLSVLCSPGDAAKMERIMFVETPTFGVRRRLVERAILKRRHETVATPFGEIHMKIGEREGVTTATPEFEDCRAAALEHGVALREVIAAADAAWRSR